MASKKDSSSARNVTARKSGRRKRAIPKKHRDFLAKNRHRYQDLLDLQGGRCALCETKPSANRRLDLDHDHKRMVIRGLLCHRCNRVLADWVTSDWLRRAVEYLEQSNRD